MRRESITLPTLTAAALACGLLALIAGPLVILALRSSPAALLDAIGHPLVGPALRLSAVTSLIALAVIIVAGTPLSWVLARRSGPGIRIVQTVIELPIVIPPAVIGIALLLTFGRNGALGGLGASIPFSPAAVVVAQVVVAAPFYVQSATAGFRAVDDDLMLVARTLGCSPARAALRIAIPIALPALGSGAALAWARALGEFGATLLFAGNLTGRTQTMPLAIYTALEVDVDVAATIAVLLGTLAFTTLWVARSVTQWGSNR